MKLYKKISKCNAQIKTIYCVRLQNLYNEINPKLYMFGVKQQLLLLLIQSAVAITI